MNEADKFLSEKQNLYYSDVGLLLYQVKHSCPDIANLVRELSKIFDGSNMAVSKEIHRDIISGYKRFGVVD